MQTQPGICQFRNLMNFQKRRPIIRLCALMIGIAVIFLAACQAAPAVESSSIESATIVNPTMIPTRVQPTEVPTLAPSETSIPTVTATITPTPKPQLDPEMLATAIENVTGKWAFRVMGGGEGDAAIFTLAADGTHSIDAIGGYHAGMNLGTGKYWFEDAVMMIYSEDCTSVSVDFFTCTAKYKVYYAMGENGVGSLRFAAIDDPHPDRKKSLHGKTLFPAVIE